MSSPFGQTFDNIPFVVDGDLNGNWDHEDLNMFDQAEGADSNMEVFDTMDSSRMFENAFSSPQLPNTSKYEFSSPTGPRKDTMIQFNQPQGAGPMRSAASSSSPESSAQDSSSDSSDRRKRKTSSPSVTLDPKGIRESGKWAKESEMGTHSHKDSGILFGGSMSSAAFEPDMESINRTMEKDFDFESAASSPGNHMGAAPPNHNVTNLSSFMRSSKNNNIPATIRPATFLIGGSREASPLSGDIPSNHSGSPAMFNNDSPPVRPSDLTGPTSWQAQFQNPTWNPDYGNTDYMTIAHSPPVNTGLSPYMQSAGPSNTAPAQLDIDPIPAKSRVETQINIKLKLHPMPPGIKKLHLPTHTISKPKMLAKTVARSPDTLELYTSLVCTSAMRNPEFEQRALARAAGQGDIVNSGARRLPSTEVTQETDDVDDPDKPLNGGEVRICSNCINRERKRASRKRVKKQEDEELWNSYENDRVIVFNTVEYKEWQTVPPTELNLETPSSQVHPEGTMQIEVPMRIACYCRHQSEKAGFQVIFTIKDHEDRLVAQGMTQSILITDDHKTHAPSSTVPMQGNPFTDMSQHPNTFMQQSEMMESQPVFRHRPYHSTNDLASLRGGNFQQTYFNSNPTIPPSVAGAMTPRNLSRQASPTAQIGPSKKRKQSSSIQKIPSALTMTQVNTTQSSSVSAPLSAGPLSAGAASGFPNAYMSPTAPSFMVPPAPMPGPFQTGPSTPNSNSGLITPAGRSGSVDNITYQQPYFSAPNSAHQSRAPSPVPSARNMNAYQNQVQVGNVLQNNSIGLDFGVDTLQQAQQPPIIHKVIPGEGPTTGGIEVTCLGQNFDRSIEVMFGDTAAITTTFWSPNSLVCMLPPGKAGTVPVTFRDHRQASYSQSTNSGPSSVFKYVDDSERQLMEMALRLICQKRTGNPDNFRDFARHLVHGPWSYESNSGASGYQAAQGHPNFNAALLGVGNTEDVLLKCLDTIDMDDSPHQARYNLRAKGGATMLSLACGLGYNRFVAGLLARGANPDSRDRGGFTPLMMASLHGHCQIVRRLILKGADPMMRSLQGYLASDLAASEEVLNSLQRIQFHSRTRSGGAISIKSRTSSMVSSRSVWEPPSPSQASTFTSGEDDIDDVDDGELMTTSLSSTPWIRSRRNSTAVVQDVRTVVPTVPSGHALTPAAAMSAWRDQLANQIQHFQQNMHWNFPNFQLPQLPQLSQLPALPTYTPHPMIRRISNLVPHQAAAPSPSASSERTATPTDYSWRDLFSTPTLPPAYEEIYPQNVDKDMDVKKSSTMQAAAEAILDQACMEKFDTTHAESSTTIHKSLSMETLDVKIGSRSSITKEQQEQIRRAHQQKLKRIRSDRNLFFIWIPLLLFIMATMVRTTIPDVISTVSSIYTSFKESTSNGQSIYTSFKESASNEQIVEFS
ncbi:hypothetical protein M501DRAFT_1018330 [Patellaria atrata CBS 101060]|uniref:IPT/TIG domain-containing protein n=1 Tax=Patellaria atrata CBS 101060 TaxID=1346257 RepID=A0A9P4S683_9PEZI|nr:hypothetical protein M501DRAFT_1018330 [Patellaria atrata CBS 101060]